MRVLAACEFSGRVRDAFRKLGHEAWSCDLEPSLTPGLHYQGDVTDLLDGWVPVRHQCECDPDGSGWCGLTDSDPSTCPCLGPTQDGLEYKDTERGLLARPIDHPHWDLMVAHPPCTYLSVSGIHWNNRGRGWDKTESSLAFVRQLLDAPVPKIALENPVSIISSRIRKPDQIIQPHKFGHPESKATCLWLKGLPKLLPTTILPLPQSGRWANQTPSGQNKLGPSPSRAAQRSLTYQGIADAMASQWGGL